MKNNSLSLRKMRRKIRVKGERVSGFVVQAKKNISIVIFILLIILGMIIGNLAIRSDLLLSVKIKGMFENYLTLISTQTMLENITNQIIISSSLLVSLFLLGFFSIGTPIITLIQLLKGIGIGALSGYMYSTHSFSGFGYCMLLLYPFEIFQCVCIVLAGNESYYISSDLFLTLRNKKSTIQEDSAVMKYLSRYLILIMISLFVSLLSGIANSLLINIFKF